MPSDMAYRSHFGSWGKALKAAGFNPTKFIPVGARKGKRNKKRKLVDFLGYDCIFEPSHPLSEKNGYVKLHRKIMFDAGFLINRSDIVHHKNKNKKDNRIDNLEVLSNSAHTSLHFKGKKIPRIKSIKCYYDDCLNLTASKYALCTKHYKLQWQRVKNGLLKDIYENPELCKKED